MNLLRRSISSLKENKAIALLTLFTACLPLFTVNCIQGHDIDYHLLRVEALKTGILEGHPFLRVNLLFFGGEGYASSMFYPDFLLYIPAVLRAAGVGINLSWHIFVGFCILAAFLAMYFSMFYITGNSAASMVSAVAFSLCRYHLDDIYTRAAVGEYSAMIFIPLVIAGLYDLTEKEFKRPYLLGAGMTGVLLCHTLSFMFCLIMCVVVLVIRFPVLVKSPGRLLKLMITAVFTLCLTAFYWLPVLEQMAGTEFKYKDPIFDVNYEKLLLKDIFSPSPGRMGIALFILALTGLLIKHKGDALIRTADMLLLTGFVFTLCATGFFPWKRFEGILYGIQFPWRLFIMSSILLPMASGIYIGRLSENRERLMVTAVTAFMIMAAVAVINGTETGYYSYSDDYYDEVKFTNTVIGGEWLPKTVKERGILGGDPGNAVDSEGRKLPVSRKGGSLTFSASGEAYVDVPFVFYKGYSSVDSSGAELRTDGSGYNGRVRVWDPGEGEVRVYYKGTALQRFADILSFFTAFLGIVIAGVGLRRVSVILKRSEGAS